MNKYLIAAVSASLLAACDANVEPEAAPAPRLLAAGPADPQAYAPSVAAIYLAYFGRPADPYAEVNFAAALGNLGLPREFSAINAAYSDNAALRVVIDSFGDSAESNTLFGSGDEVDFVVAIYEHVLGRVPDFPGLKFWVEAILRGELSRSRAALSIMAAAMTNTSPQGLRDRALIENRIRFAALLTSALSRDSVARAAYRGDAAAAAGRQAVAGVHPEDTHETLSEKVQDFIRRIS